jgi:hypothetical protein
MPSLQGRKPSHTEVKCPYSKSLSWALADEPSFLSMARLLGSCDLWENMTVTKPDDSMDGYFQKAALAWSEGVGMSVEGRGK